MRNLRCAHLGRLITISVLLTISSNLEAETPKDLQFSACEQKLSLDEFRAYAMSRSPLIAEIDRDYAGALAKAFDTETWQNPEVQAETTFTRMAIQGANDNQVQVSIGQPMRLSNFGTRAKVAELIKNSGDAEKKAKVLELVQKLSIQYKTLKAFEDTKAILHEAEARATKQVTTIREGVRKGLLSKGDESLFEGEKYLLKAQGKQVATTVAMLQRDLSRSIGMPCAIRTSASFPPEPIPALDILVSKASQSGISEGARIELVSKLAKEHVRLADLDSIPQITPRLLYQHTNDGGDFVGAGVSVPLPFWNQNQAERMRASADARVAELRTRFITDGGLTNQIQAMHIAGVNAHEQAEIFTSKVVPAFERALQAQQRLYTEGKGNVLQIWQTLRAYNDAQTQSLQLWLLAAATRAELSILIGEEV